MPAHFEIRNNAKIEGTGHTPATQEWVVLVGGNGQVMMTSETYPIGHGNANRAIEDIIEATGEATDIWHSK